MKMQFKRVAAAFIATAMLIGSTAGCANSGNTPATGSSAPAGSTSAASNAAASGYPIKPEEPGSGTVKWAETDTPDGWTEVTNEGGTTLGYSKSSGVSLIQVEGFAFKDLNRNGELDLYEDWRQESNARSEDVASKLTVDDVAGLMLYSGHQFAVEDKVNDEQKAFLDMGLRAVLSAASASPTDVQAKWANAMQAYTEGLGLGIPVNFSTDPRDVGVSIWPGNLALAATFDPEIARESGKQLSKEFRALGLGTLLGSQIDLATEPRWIRVNGTFGEDPALSRDMTNAVTGGYQSTYDSSGADIGWGSESVNAMIKHWPGDGAAQSGRESHDFSGQHAVYPGGQFETHLIPFVDGGFKLDSKTESATAIMASYSIAWSEDESLGTLAGSAFSEYKLNLLRSYGFEGVACTDWGVIGGMMDTGWGVQELSQGERCYKAITAGIDQFGGLNDPTPVKEAYELGVEEFGEDAMLARFQESGSRLLRNYFTVGLFDNPYVSVAYALETVGSSDAVAAGYDAQLKSVVMLKNDGDVIKAAGDEKPTVYIPMVFTAETPGFFGSTPASAVLPVDAAVAGEYFNIVTDKLSETFTGPAGEDGKPTVAYEDIIRATKEELADCDLALVFASNPLNYKTGFMGGGYDPETKSYIPLSLQYGPYTANSASVRTESIAGPMTEQEVKSVYGVQKVMAKENTSYFGNSSNMSNATDLDMILYAADNVPESAKVIVAIKSTGPMIFSEFESQVDAILIGFDVNNKAFLDIASGKVEPSALLPVQMPKDMETVEAQKEDVPRDMDCYVDAQGNTYDFAYGLNWSGVISDARTAKYNVPALVKPEATPGN